MTISNMTIFLKTLKYDYMQYEYFFEKIVIFYEKNMTKKKKPMMGTSSQPSYSKISVLKIE